MPRTWGVTGTSLNFDSKPVQPLEMEHNTANQRRILTAGIARAIWKLERCSQGRSMHVDLQVKGQPASLPLTWELLRETPGDLRAFKPSVKHTETTTRSFQWRLKYTAQLIHMKCLLAYHLSRALLIPSITGNTVRLCPSSLWKCWSLTRKPLNQMQNTAGESLLDSSVLKGKKKEIAEAGGNADTFYPCYASGEIFCSFLDKDNFSLQHLSWVSPEVLEDKRFLEVRWVNAYLG